MELVWEKYAELSYTKEKQFQITCKGGHHLFVVTTENDELWFAISCSWITLSFMFCFVRMKFNKRINIS